MGWGQTYFLGQWGKFFSGVIFIIDRFSGFIKAPVSEGYTFFV
jgi:hypothetical protein